MLENITYYSISGKPLIMYVGILALCSFLVTAMIAVINRKKNSQILFRLHPWMAVFSIILALIHGILGILIYF